jgi:hypothetical protein
LSRQPAISADEALAEQRRVTARGGKNLDGDVALEARIDRAPDLAHAARAEPRDNLVMQQLVPDHAGVTFSIPAPSFDGLRAPPSYGSLPRFQRSRHLPPAERSQRR